MTVRLHRLARWQTWRCLPTHATHAAKRLLALPVSRRAAIAAGRLVTGVRALSVGDENTRFLHFGWETLSVVPPADHLANIATGRLPFDDAAVELINASHVIEHLRDAQLDHFLKEAFRILSPTGLLRIAVPDLEGFIESYYRDGLAKHFDWRLSDQLTMRKFKEQQVREGREDPGVLLPHNGLVSIVASYTNGHPLPTVSKKEVDEHLRDGDIDGFVHWCVSLKDTSREDFGHFNGFTFDRLKGFLNRAGFRDVVRSACGETNGIRLFRGIDRPEEESVSLYVNARKGAA